jgi:hypothetical protein
MGAPGITDANHRIVSHETLGGVAQLAKVMEY